MKKNDVLYLLCALYVCCFWYLRYMFDLLWFDIWITGHVISSVLCCLYICMRVKSQNIPICILILDGIFHGGCVVILFNAGNVLLCSLCLYSTILLAGVVINLIYKQRRSVVDPNNQLQLNLITEMYQLWEKGEFIEVYEKIDMLNSKSLVQLAFTLDFQTPEEKDLFKNMISS